MKCAFKKIIWKILFLRIVSVSDWQDIFCEKEIPGNTQPIQVKIMISAEALIKTSGFEEIFQGKFCRKKKKSLCNTKLMLAYLFKTCSVETD